jgi:hypothetical protein
MTGRLQQFLQTTERLISSSEIRSMLIKIHRSLQCHGISKGDSGAGGEGEVHTTKHTTVPILNGRFCQTRISPGDDSTIVKHDVGADNHRYIVTSNVVSPNDISRPGQAVEVECGVYCVNM